MLEVLKHSTKIATKAEGSYYFPIQQLEDVREMLIYVTWYKKVVNNFE